MTVQEIVDALRLLSTGDDDAASRLARAPPRPLARQLREQVVLLRVAEALDRRGLLSTQLSEAAETERARVAEAWLLVGHLHEMCRKNEILHAFPKVSQHEPDMGHDVDLLVLDQSADVDARILVGLSARPGSSSLFNRISMKRAYDLSGSRTPVEIHHGRLGLVGEQVSLARHVVEKAWTRRAEPTVPIPRAEQLLLVQAAQRVLGHRSLRVGDVLRGRALLAEIADVGSVAADAKRLGLATALRTYAGALVAASEIADLPEVQSTNALRATRVRLRPTGRGFLLAAGDPARGYAAHLAHDLRWGRLGTAARVTALPVAAAWTILARRLTGVEEES